MGEIYISAFTADFRHYDSLMDWISTFPGLTVGAEMAVAWITPDFYDLLEPQIPRFRNVPITLHGPFMEMCPIAGSETEDALNQQLQLSCELYHRLNARSIVLHTHLRADADRQRICDVLNCWIPKMTAQGMSVTVENVGYPAKGNALFSQEEFVRLFDDLPEEAGCLIDLGHAMLNGWDIPRLIRTMGTKIRGYHIHSNNGQKDSHVPIHDPSSLMPPEEMDDLLRVMGEVTPDAHLILEYAPGSHVTKELLHRDIRHVAQLCGLLPGAESGRGK